MFWLCRRVDGQLSGEAAVGYEAQIATADAWLAAEDPDEAVVVAREAVREADASGPGAVARALRALGQALVRSGEPDAGEEALREAIRLADPADHATAADAWHHLGLARQAREDLTEAERCLRQALHCREAALGPDHPWLARAWGELARVAFQRGGRGAGVASLLLKAQGILDRALTRPGGPVEPVALRFDAYTVASNLTMVRLQDARWDEALVALESALAHLEAFVALGGAPPDGVRGRLDAYLDALDDASPPRVDQLRMRLARTVADDLSLDASEDLSLELS